MTAFTILADAHHMHRSEVAGTVISREQVLVVGGQHAITTWWTEWSTGHTVRVDNELLSADAAAQRVEQLSKLIAAGYARAA